jgi:F-type H+-transporting ATPase subunit a
VASDPMHQFQIERLIPLDAGGIDISFSNASIYLLAGALVPATLLLMASAKAALVPGRGQMAGETLYGFLRKSLEDAAGAEGVKMFLPLVATLFCFILSLNLVGLWGYAFNPNSQIVVTASMALLVFFTVIVVGLIKNGLGFFKLFFPAGIPWPLYIIVTPIEIISFFARPLSHSVRLWANIFAGGVLIKVFAGFVPAMIEAGAVGAIGSILPFVMTVALFALKFLVAFLQAYVFALLTCLYLNDALHAGHH